MATIHISAAEAARDFPELLERVRAGAEVVIEDDASPPVVLRMVKAPLVRRLSESLGMAQEHGCDATLDGGFAADLEAIQSSHGEPLENRWD